VLAAANPSFGRYNFRKSISENVNLPNSLLSRFDLLFIIVDKMDTSSDISLSKHVLFVHRYLHNPTTTNQIIEPQLMKAYIAEARKVNPSIPKDLSNYIVEAYISMRSQSKNWLGKADDQTALTPRQLLSILRLSQSLARLRLSTNVSHADVDEALRLIQSSKASLTLEKVARGAEDFSSTIFNIVRDAIPLFQNRTMDYNIIEGMILKRGFTGEQFQKSLAEYENLGILLLDDMRTKITLAT
jgi:DNA replication licensing factor MCM7